MLKSRLGLLTINRLIDPGRRIEYNFLGSINRKAASPRHADTRLCRVRLCRDRHAAAVSRRLSRDTRTRAQDRVHIPTTINIETSCARPQGGRKAALPRHAASPRAALPRHASRRGSAATHGRGHKIACTYLPRLI